MQELSELEIGSKVEKPEPPTYGVHGKKPKEH